MKGFRRILVGVKESDLCFTEIALGAELWGKAGGDATAREQSERERGLLQNPGRGCRQPEPRPRGVGRGNGGLLPRRQTTGLTWTREPGGIKTPQGESLRESQEVVQAFGQRPHFSWG